MFYVPLKRVYQENQWSVFSWCMTSTPAVFEIRSLRRCYAARGESSACFSGRRQSDAAIEICFSQRSCYCFGTNWKALIFMIFVAKRVLVLLKWKRFVITTRYAGPGRSIWTFCDLGLPQKGVALVGWQLDARRLHYWNYAAGCFFPCLSRDTVIFEPHLKNVLLDARRSLSNLATQWPLSPGNIKNKTQELGLISSGAPSPSPTS